MKPITIAALVAVALTLSGCDREEVDYYEALLTGKTPPPADTYVAGSLVIEEIIEAETEPEPEPVVWTPPPLDFTIIEGEYGPWGEPVGTGADCRPVFRELQCRD